MLSWLKSWFVRTPEKEYQPPGDDLDIYMPRRRNIYKYYNGTEVINADPMEIYKKLMEIGPDLDTDIKVANSEHSDNKKAMNNVITKLRGLFNLKDFTEGGLTHNEVLGLFDHYINYCNSVKKN